MVIVSSEDVMSETRSPIEESNESQRREHRIDFDDEISLRRTKVNSRVKEQVEKTDECSD